MKKTIKYLSSIICFALFIFAINSCEKCLTCTFEEENSSDSTRVEEVCGSGTPYRNQIDHYEDRGWVCE